MNVSYPHTPEFSLRIRQLLARVQDPFSQADRYFTELFSWKISKYHTNEYYQFFAIAWSLVFLKKIRIEDDFFLPEEQKNLGHLSRLFAFENKCLWKEFLAEIFQMEDDLVVFQMIFKYVLVSHQGKFSRLVPQWTHYRHMIGYVYLVLLGALNLSKIEGIMQDIYFQEFYPKEYLEMNRRIRAISSGMRSHFFTVNIVNELAYIMTETEAWGAVHIRFKSYFSIYNKILRKGLEHILDIIGLRLVFPDTARMQRFVEVFEKKFSVVEKKDYVAHPKANGYQSIHYKFFYHHLQVSSYVELQVRTREMDKAIEENDSISSFSYALAQKKYHQKFIEIHEGLREIVRLAQNHS